MSAERDELVSALLALQRVARLAYAAGARPAAVEAAVAAKRIERALILDRSGCPGCGGSVPDTTAKRGRPRRWCESCRPPRPGQYRSNMPRGETVEP